MKYANERVVDVSFAILVGWQFKDSHVCHGQSVRGPFDRDFDEFEVRYQGKHGDFDVSPQFHAYNSQVHNTHIGTAKKSKRSSD
jgi:hypothetical protein